MCIPRKKVEKKKLKKMADLIRKIGGFSSKLDCVYSLSQWWGSSPARGSCPPASAPAPPAAPTPPTTIIDRIMGQW